MLSRLFILSLGATNDTLSMTRPPEFLGCQPWREQLAADPTKVASCPEHRRLSGLTLLR